MSFFSKPNKAKPATASKAPTDDKHMPWIEKYRPRSMDDITAQEEVVQVLKSCLKSQNLPHLLFYGPPGTGKTSAILALTRDMFGPELMKSRVLELNASDERGIKVVREKIKNFARSTVSGNVSGRSVPPYKIIILDEADSMTGDAQAALRRTMENYSKITRFCLICNYVSRIIEPLASRCAKFRFKPLPIEQSERKLASICDQESLRYDPGALREVITASEGDLRRATMFLQSAHNLQQGEPITVPVIQEIAGVIPPDRVVALTESWSGPGATYETLKRTVDEAVWSGFSAHQIISQIHDLVVGGEGTGNWTSLQKARVAQAIGEIDKAISDGADEHLQLVSFMLQASQIMR
ncbi:Subunit of heteropentameric Replication factor C (RF-C) [Tieghemiomyces parasiticus]|uniref:Subunit of heteropentameric Replication factor C (RF-C) n=1 Tax=Tieghemiomyces parasiticus TaxID=78921 RepID=A0A9W8ABM9_9FUNG|nr:Subunit of heteropentameric Replication factor C (RF-C) [Tieghemiomyces parasiticus]